MGIKSPVILLGPKQYSETIKPRVSRKTALTWAKEGKITKYFILGKKKYYLNPAERPEDD